MNLGQLALLLRGRFLVDVQSVTKVAGMAFLADELEAIIDSAIDGTLIEKRKRQRQNRQTRGSHRERWRGCGSGRMTDLIGVELPLVAGEAKTAGVPRAENPLKAKDFTSDQEVRWCPGCGDYVILNTVRNFLPELGLRRETWSSSVGSAAPAAFRTTWRPTVCTPSTDVPDHGDRACLARPDLSVWVVTGDGDALSIGGNHLIHALRRNVNLTILLFNNRIYGLTKGQIFADIRNRQDHQVDTDGIAGSAVQPGLAGVGRGGDVRGTGFGFGPCRIVGGLAGRRATPRAALVEILQDCPIFNDGSFDALRKEGAEDRLINLKHGQPITFGAEGEYCVVKAGFGGLEVANRECVGVGDRCPRRAYRRSGLRFRAVAVERPEPRAHGDRNLPSGDQTLVRRRGTVAGRFRPGVGGTRSRCVAGAAQGRDTWTVD